MERDHQRLVPGIRCSPLCALRLPRRGRRGPGKRFRQIARCALRARSEGVARVGGRHRRAAARRAGLSRDRHGSDDRAPREPAPGAGPGGELGTPETSGLPTIDYYLSAEELEPEAAQAHYTDRLVALPHLGCHFEPLNIAPAPVDPAQAGIDARLPLLVCPGGPLKYPPQHHWGFPEISRRLGRCRFIFFSHLTRSF